jgi:hypothetical protein
MQAVISFTFVNVADVVGLAEELSDEVTTGTFAGKGRQGLENCDDLLRIAWCHVAEMAEMIPDRYHLSIVHRIPIVPFAFLNDFGPEFVGPLQIIGFGLK